MDGEGCMDVYLAPPDSRQIALGNHLILSSIFKFVKAKELKSFRQVSRPWCDIATHLLKKNRSLKCRRHYKIDLNIFKSVVSSSTFPALICEWDFGDICDQSYDSKAKSITSFLERWNAITEGGGGNEKPWYSSGVAIAISSTYWRSWDGNTSRIIELVKQILTGVKNIVTLTLNLDLDSLHKRNLLSRLHFQCQLPHLESIHFILDSNRETETSTGQNLISSLLDAAPNLKEVKGAKYHIWAMLLDTNKAHNLKEFQVDLKGLYGFFPRDDLNDRLKELMEAVPVMESFELPDHVLSQYIPNLHNPLRELWVPSRILIHYSKTLRTIKATQLSFLDVWTSHEELDLPVFQKLTFLELKNSWVVPLLPNRSSTTFMFPHLHHVKLDLKGCSGDNMKVYFSKDDAQDSGFVTMPLVRKLELNCRYDKKGMQILAQVFPNVKEMTLYQEIGKYVHSLQNGIWHMPQSVETLTLHYLAVTFRRTKLRNLDEVFTGISNRMLKTLPRNLAAKPQPQLTIAARNGIRKLKGLKSLRIIFDVNEVAVHRSLLAKNERLSKEEILESLETPFFLEKDSFTALSRLYAFEPAAFSTCICYDSHVHCASQIRKFLEPLLSPCVILDHYYISEKSEGLKVTLTTEAMDNAVYPVDLITSWFDKADGAGSASANLMET